MSLFSSQSVACMPQTAKVADYVKLFSITDSTQNFAREIVQNNEISERSDGKPTIFAIAADDQTAGRGRLGREWVSRPGESFLVSFLTLLPKKIVTNADINGWLPIIAGLSARDALLDVFSKYKSSFMHGEDCKLKLKWPNDIFLHDCKEGGILTELVAVPGREDLMGVVFGIGMNLYVPQEVLPIKKATSLQMHITKLPEAQELRDVIAASIVTRLRSRLYDFVKDYQNNVADLLKEVTCVCWTLDREVNVHPVDGSVITGTAVCIGKNASLTIRAKTGEDIVVKSGDVHAVAYDEDVFPER